MDAVYPTSFHVDPYHISSKKLKRKGTLLMN